jgi:hypothetical protein
MTGLSPIKTSSRAGRFKKKLVSEDQMLAESPVVRARLAPFQDLFSSGKLSQAEFTAAYLIVFLSHRFPGSWLGSANRGEKISGISWRDLPFEFEANIVKRLASVNSLMDIFAGFALKSTPMTVNRAILEWNAGNYGLELMFGIPSAAKVLQQQKTGRRCVTTICDERISNYILGERDALSFTMHDLIHADHFYHNNECFEGQLGFYGLLDQTLSYFDLSNEKFASEFEYVIADMNAYAVHLMKCLKSAMIHYFNDDYFRAWLVGLNAPAGLYALNTSEYVPESMDAEILRWLSVFKNTSSAPN